jgi:uncharacterized C2H2 Zn-finger protein
MQYYLLKDGIYFCTACEKTYKERTGIYKHAIKQHDLKKERIEWKKEKNSMLKKRAHNYNRDSIQEEINLQEEQKGP